MIGLVTGGLLYALAAWFKYYLPAIISGLIGTIFVFTLLLLLALIEMPMMVFAMRRMATSAGSPRGLITLTNMGYVAFASVYAIIFVLLTGDNYFSLGNVLAALCIARFASGAFIE